jgi:hypothetical protein
MARGRFATWGAMGCCVVLGVAGCGSGDDDDDESSDAPRATGDETETDGETDDQATDEPSTTAIEGDIAPASTTATVTQPPATVTEVDILTDFGDVCRGVGLPGATGYDVARTGIHPLVSLAGEEASFEPALGDLPDQWDPVIGEEATVELVVCMSRTASTLRQTCDGYEDDDGNDTGNTVEMYDATYDVRLLAATTADEVASTQLDATDDVCPMLVFFDGDDTVEERYAEPTDALTAWLVEHVET